MQKVMMKSNVLLHICLFQKKIISYMHYIHCSSYFLEMLPLCDLIILKDEMTKHDKYLLSSSHPQICGHKIQDMLAQDRWAQDTVCMGYVGTGYAWDMLALDMWAQDMHRIRGHMICTGYEVGTGYIGGHKICMGYVSTG